MTDDGIPAHKFGGVLETNLVDLPPWATKCTPDDFVLRCPFMRAKRTSLVLVINMPRRPT
jgi:hypothetical protein